MNMNILNIRKYFILASIGLYLPLDATYYRWTDDDGKTHYSYSIPASKSQLGHVEINKQGMKTKKVISAKRKKQLKKLEKIRQLQKDQAAKASKKQEYQDKEDNLLLSVFSTEKELVKAYGTKLQLAQVTIDLLKTRHKVQSEKLEVLEQRYEKLVDIKHKQAVEKQIDAVLDNLKIYQHAITENLIEKDKVKDDYKHTLIRFKKLMVKSETTSN